MRHGFAVLTIGDRQFIEISADEFNAIKEARANLLIALAIEEKFEILIQNYSEYERTLLDLALQKMIRQEYVWGTFADARQVLNRRIMNVLTAARAYIDQTQSDLSTLYGSSHEAHDVFSREYDQSLGYRVMHAIRNHVQHHSLPVGTLSYPSGWQQENGIECLRFGLELELDLDRIRSNSHFIKDRKGRAMLAELESNPMARDLTLMLRQFVESLGRVHATVRELTRQDVEGWTATLLKAIASAQTQIKPPATPAAVQEDDDGHNCEVIYLNSHFVERLRTMRNRYANLSTLSRWYVSSGTGTTRQSPWRPVDS